MRRLDFSESSYETADTLSEANSSQVSKPDSESTFCLGINSSFVSVTPLAVNKRILARKNLQAYSKSKSLATVSEGSLKSSMQPARALFNYYEFLSDFEMEEIRSYSEVFYVGQNCQKSLKNRKKHTNSEGYYIGAVGDHLAYRYEIKSILGTGNFGEVFLCWDHKQANQIAVKVSRIQENYRKATEDESEILTQLSLSEDPSKDHIIEKYSDFEFRNHFCMGVEVLSLSLKDSMEKRNYQGLPLHHIRRIAIQTLSALTLIHSHKIIHCDLKPDNILLLSQKRFDIKIIDFGSASQEGSNAKEYVQSRPYRAPEIVIEAPYNKSIDIWSFACILVEIATGQQLFPAISEMQLFRMFIETIGMPSMEFLNRGKRKQLYVLPNGKMKVAAKAFECGIETRLQGLDPRFIELIKECLKWDPEERITVEGALGHRWILDN